jgi:hypothetical protein
MHLSLDISGLARFRVWLLENRPIDHTPHDDGSDAPPPYTDDSSDHELGHDIGFSSQITRTKTHYQFLKDSTLTISRPRESSEDNVETLPMRQARSQSRAGISIELFIGIWALIITCVAIAILLALLFLL